MRPNPHAVYRSYKTEKFVFENCNRLQKYKFLAQVATIQIESLERKNI